VTPQQSNYWEEEGGGKNEGERSEDEMEGEERWRKNSLVGDPLPVHYEPTIGNLY
jgi:hypothetical protein